MPTWLHDGAAGVEIRRPGEPCPHRHRVSYTDTYGLYSRCAVCGAHLSPQPAGIDAEQLVESAPTDPIAPPARRGRNDCSTCGATHRPYFGQWWRTQWGSRWFCSTECATRHNQPIN